MSEAKSGLYYIQDTRQIVGNTPLFWIHNSCGYVSDIDEALKVDKETALKMQRGRSTDIAWPCEFIESLAKRRVDVQYMHSDFKLKANEVSSERSEQ